MSANGADAAFALPDLRSLLNQADPDMKYQIENAIFRISQDL
ncbi:MAG TPA: hypothetical protein VGB30_13445 [bacterium]